MRGLRGVAFILGIAIATHARSADEPASHVAEATPAQIEQLVRDLGDDSFETREKATAKLVGLGRKALPALEAAAKASDPEVRTRASKAVEAIKSSPTFLFDGLKDRNATVRKQSAERLGRLGAAGKAAIPMLLPLLKDPDEGVREATIGALLNIDPKHEATAKLVPAKASADGKYKTLLRRIKVPQDQQNYKDYCDYGRFDGTSWAGFDNLPPGFWVYVYPYWFIWGEQVK